MNFAVLTSRSGNECRCALSYWIKYPQGIAGSTTIYNAIAVGFGATSNSFLGTTQGESPILSTTYAAADNGRTVFSLYDNFKGTTLNASVWASGSATISNGATVVSWVYIRSCIV